MKLDFGVPADDSAPMMQFGLSRGAFLRAYEASARDALENFELFVDFIADAWRLDREIVARSMEREGGRYCIDGSIDLAGLAKALAIQEELGTLAHPLKAEEVLDRRFVPGFS
jgi:hypothetical protein